MIAMLPTFGRPGHPPGIAVRPLKINHTDRGAKIRIISTRDAAHVEREAYEDEIKDEKADDLRP